MKNSLTIATRQSRLALWQAEAVKQALEQRYKSLKVELLPITTTGDRITNVPLADIGGKALFIKELEQAIFRGDADIAVHSAKDMPPELHEDLILAAALPREDARDCFIAVGDTPLEAMPEGAIIGTSSPRRAAQLNQFYPKLQIKPLRGNVNTRIHKLQSSHYQGIILAMAGLKRLGCMQTNWQPLPLEQFVPSVGQGTIAIECRHADKQTLALLAGINDTTAMTHLLVERQVIATLQGDCYSAVGVYAHAMEDNQLHLTAMVLKPDGSQLIVQKMSSTLTEADELGLRLGKKCLEHGAEALLR